MLLRLDYLCIIDIFTFCVRTIKMGTCDEVHFTCKLSVKGKKAKWYIKNQVG